MSQVGSIFFPLFFFYMEEWGGFSLSNNKMGHPKGCPILLSFFLFAHQRCANALFICTPKVCKCPLSPGGGGGGGSSSRAAAARGASPRRRVARPGRRRARCPAAAAAAAPDGGRCDGGGDRGMRMRRRVEDFLTFFLSFLFFDLNSIKHTSIAHS